jgi:hypothetical protein
VELDRAARRKGGNAPSMASAQATHLGELRRGTAGVGERNWLGNVAESGEQEEEMTIGGVYASACDRGHDPRGRGHGVPLRRGNGGRADRRGSSVSSYARAKRLAGGSYTAARAERHAWACGCANGVGPPSGEGGGGVRRARGRGLNGQKGRDRGSWASLAFPISFRISNSFSFYFL